MTTDRKLKTSLVRKDSRLKNGIFDRRGKGLRIFIMGLRATLGLRLNYRGPRRISQRRRFAGIFSLSPSPPFFRDRQAAGEDWKTI